MLCGIVVSVGLAHLTTPTIVFALFLVCRAIYGLFGSATSPANPIYIAERTCPGERTVGRPASPEALALAWSLGQC